MVQWTSDLKIRWTSNLSSSSFFDIISPRLFQIDCLRFELGMTLFLYGAILRERALEVLPADLVQSATLFRKAAGVYHYLAHEVLPSLQPALAAEKPPESIPSVSTVMSLICLAEAQAVTIKKAEEKGNTGGLLAKLHYGVTQLLDEATSVLYSATGGCKDISLRFVDFISSCKALYELRSQKYLAEGLKIAGQVGIAVGVLQQALINAKKKMPGEESWRLVFRQEIDSVSDMLRKFEHENEFVWHEKIASGDELPLPEGKKIVSFIPYHPQRWERELFIYKGSVINYTHLQPYRLGRVVSAVISEENAVGSSYSGTDVFKLTYLEGNSWLWDVGGLRILVDPILVGNLDFGIPWLYDAAKKFLKSFRLSDLPEVDCLLITQSLDDHCHLKTLKPLSEMFPKLRVIATPNAKELLDPLFSNVTYLEPGQSSEIEARNGFTVRIRATAGPVLGPPWQRPENGYLVFSPLGQLTLYYEPHCVYNKNFLEKERADIVITPVIKQLLPSFTLVSGQEDAVQLAKLLHARFIVPMKNGDLDSKGLLASIIQAEGTIESFKELLSKELQDAQILEPTPGVPLEISGPLNLP
ncbi:hypothetical protein L1049_005764 [Liquidambar formosana]|uniref:BRO1 domain-containing protein n=1 Tax=Liquidambar formosana TaxID=63359 RepID=A0AAP0WSE6_LIQFO